MSFHPPYSSRRNNRLRASLYRAQSGCCGICGKRLKSLLRVTVDHVWPRANGGKNDGNRIATHRRCNERKADRQPTGCEVIWLEAANAGIWA